MTNCDIGPGCGMYDLVGIAVALFLVVVIVGIIIRFKHYGGADD